MIPTTKILIPNDAKLSDQAYATFSRLSEWYAHEEAIWSKSLHERQGDPVLLAQLKRLKMLAADRWRRRNGATAIYGKELAGMDKKVKRSRATKLCK